MTDTTPTIDDLTRPMGPHTEAERVCFARGMEQWRASLKRPDMSEEDRVKGALDAYCRQAFALSALGAEPVAYLRQHSDGVRMVASLNPELDVWQKVEGGWSVEPLYAAPRPSPAISDEAVERAARAIYECWQFGKDDPELKGRDKPAWAPKGNSTRQTEARAYARAALEAGKV